MGAGALAGAGRRPDGLGLALAGAGLYGVNILGARLAAEAGISGVTLVLYRALPMLGFGLAAMVLARTGASVPRAERAPLLVLGLATSAVGIAYFSSVAYVPVSVAVVVSYLYPALTVLADPLLGGGAPRPRALATVGLASLGIVLVVGPALEGLDPRGLALAGAAACGSAVQFFAGNRCRETPLATKVAAVHLAVLPCAALLGLATGALNPPGDLLRAPGAVAVAVGLYVVAFLFQVTALARAPAPLVAIAFCLEPVVAALSAVLVLGERFGPLQALGAAFVLTAVAVNALSARESAVP